MVNPWIVPACLMLMTLSLFVIAAAAVLTAVEVRRTLRRVNRITGACEAVVEGATGIVRTVVNRVTSLGQEARRWWSLQVEPIGNGTRRRKKS